MEAARAPPDQSAGPAAGTLLGAALATLGVLGTIVGLALVIAGVNANGENLIKLWQSGIAVQQMSLTFTVFGGFLILAARRR